MVRKDKNDKNRKIKEKRKTEETKNALYFSIKYFYYGIHMDVSVFHSLELYEFRVKSPSSLNGFLRFFFISSHSSNFK